MSVTTAMLLAFTLAGLGAPSSVPAPPGDPPDAQAPCDPAPAPSPQVRELSDEVPADVQIDVRLEEWGEVLRVRVRRAGHLVALRRGDARQAGADEASLPVLRRELTDAALIWETTHLASLETTRGIVRLDADGAPRARLAETPLPVLREERRRHRCWSYPDGFGGSTVICRILAFASVANVTSARERDDAWVVPNVERSVVRLDLPARPDGAEARAVGYVDGLTGIVIRAESSFLPGEARPSLTVLSAEREQRVIRRPSHAFMRDVF